VIEFLKTKKNQSWWSVLGDFFLFFLEKEKKSLGKRRAHKGVDTISKI